MPEDYCGTLSYSCVCFAPTSQWTYTRESVWGAGALAIDIQAKATVHPLSVSQARYVHPAPDTGSRPPFLVVPGNKKHCERFCRAEPDLHSFCFLVLLLLIACFQCQAYEGQAVGGTL